MSADCRQAAPVRSADDLRRLDAIDTRVCALASSLGGVELQYPVLIAREVLERAEYQVAFPHLLMLARPARLPLDGVESPDPWCLSPAVCYHAYQQLAGTRVKEPVVLTARGRCFRAERETSAGVRQIEFEMREIVLVGPAAWVATTADAARDAVRRIAREFAVEGDWHEAEDPFFLPAAAGKALMQRLLKRKVELRWPGPSGVALASVNRHGTFFGERFAITLSDGRPAHTACIAIGLDRWTHLVRVLQSPLTTEAIR